MRTIEINKDGKEWLVVDLGRHACDIYLNGSADHILWHNRLSLGRRAESWAIPNEYAFLWLADNMPTWMSGVQRVIRSHFSDLSRCLVLEKVGV